MEELPVTSRECAELQHKRAVSEVSELWDLLDQVRDPELPVLSLWDLGVLRDVQRVSGRVVVTITPTYSGCPALETMRGDIERLLREEAVGAFEVRTQLAPAWSSTWISPEGRDKLRAYGIAPPEDQKDQIQSNSGAIACDPSVCGLTPEAGITCPRCGSSDSRRISEFGSTACKALFQCLACHEPFDYFKQI